MSLGARRVPFGKTSPVRNPKIPPVQSMHWFWHPFRPSVRFGPEWFRAKLKELDKDLEVTWNPVKERWLIWYRAPRFQHPICSGWKLLFPVEYQGKYGPLDERVMWHLYSRWMAKMGGAVEYWRRVEAEMDRDYNRSVKEREDSVRYGAGDFFDSMKIGVGYGRSRGDKFTKYHS